MKAELKAKWIAALRSGHYEQGRMCLRFQETYCCLGVLCVVAGRQIGASGLVDRANHDWGYAFARQVLPDMFALTELNDIEMKSFPEIADWIEKNIQAEGDAA